MRRYILKRTLYAVFIIWLVATVVFFATRALPGGPAQTMLGGKASPEAIQELRHRLGMHRPIWVQYANWMTGLITLDFGTSLTSGEQIEKVILGAAPRTFSIGMIGILTGLTVAIPTGIVSAVYKDRPLDYGATITAFLGLSMPAFFIGIVLLVVFGVYLSVLPTFGYVPMDEGVVPWFKHLLLPGIAVGLPYAAIIMRMMRSSLLEVLGEPYMKTAKAKGVPPRIRLWKHGFQNAMIPVITVAGIQIAVILVGSVTVEVVFAIEGLGRLLVDSILRRNYPVTQVVIVLIAFVLVFANLVVDIVYTFVDPRIRYGGDVE